MPEPSVLTVPGAPQILNATAGLASATLAFQASSNDGGAAITRFTATCTQGIASQTTSGASSPLVVMGLINGTAASCAVFATNSVGTSAASAAVVLTPQAPVTPVGNFTLSSSVGSDGGNLPIEYTCDGNSISPPLSWSNVPTGTQELALLMSTIPGPGAIKYNWVLYHIPASTQGVVKDAYGIGTAGTGSDGPKVGYQPPCSQGPGAKTYTFTLYALSSALSLSGSSVSGADVLTAMNGKILGQSSLNYSYTRTTQSAALTNCQYIKNSMAASTTGTATVTCDDTYAYVASNGLATHTMMNGITGTNLQVPVAQNFTGSNAWRIPLVPAVASTTTSAVDGPIGMAINGVPIFNPCKQGGCQNGDTKLLGELDICNGHAGRADDYHYHAAPTCLMAGQSASYWNTHPVGWALDGFAIFGYNNADGTVAGRDTLCGGNAVTPVNAPAGYSYHVTDASPYVLSCFAGTPSPDLAGQGTKYTPLRQPPVTPFKVSNMTLDNSTTTKVLQFTSATSFSTTSNGTNSFVNAAGTYKIRYVELTGTALSQALTQSGNAGKTNCWQFEFLNGSGSNSQPGTVYCR